jgi:glycosyltransferase involved in cell wall biosynthesis
MFTKKPYAARRFVSPKMREAIEAHLTRGLYDAVICDSPYSTINLLGTDLPIILNSHNVEHRLLSRYVAIERNPVKRLYAWSEMQKLRTWEQRTCRQAAAVLACSDLDRQLLSSLVPGLQVTVVPNVVDIDMYVAQDLATVPTIQFQGGMDWLPNRDAVSFFVETILPIFRPLAPPVRFVVAGRNPSAAFMKKFVHVPEVEFTGNVADMRAEIAKATVCVVPLRIGSGTRLKILESAAMAKAIVSTRIGAEGLDFVNGEEIVLVDEPTAFARAVADLLADAPRRHALGVAARRRVEAQYSMASLQIALRETLAKVPAATFSSAPLPDTHRVEGEVRP